MGETKLSISKLSVRIVAPILLEILIIYQKQILHLKRETAEIDKNKSLRPFDKLLFGYLGVYLTKSSYITLSIHKKSEKEGIMGTLLFYKNKQKINNLINAVEFYWKLTRAEYSHIQLTYPKSLKFKAKFRIRLRICGTNKMVDYKIQKNYLNIFTVLMIYSFLLQTFITKLKAFYCHIENADECCLMSSQNVAQYLIKDFPMIQEFKIFNVVVLIEVQRALKWTYIYHAYHHIQQNHANIIQIDKVKGDN